ncbi:MAG: hypothetical protein LBI37_01245 [Puniceicoccales bacterium]|nr:hypothetical protein [Puniceicoccales bacterium]
MNSIALKQTDVISAATMMALAFKEYTETSDFEFYKITKLQFFHFGDECLEYNVLIENIIERLHSVGYFNGDFSMDDQPAAKLITSNRRKFINSDAIDLNRSSQKSYKEKIYFKNKKPDLGSRNAGLSIPAIISKKKAKSRKRKREQKILRKIKQS